MRRASIARSAKFFVRRVRDQVAVSGVKCRVSGVGSQVSGLRKSRSLLKADSDLGSACLTPENPTPDTRHPRPGPHLTLKLGVHSDVGLQHFGNRAAAFSIIGRFLEGCGICVGHSSDHVEMYCGNCPPGVLFFHGESG